MQIDGTLAVDDSERKSIEAVIAVAVGLALKALEPGDLDIDILPPEEKIKKSRRAASASPVMTVLSWAPLALIVVGVIVLFIHYGGLTSHRDQLDREISEKTAEIQSMQQQVSRQQELNALEAQLNAKRAAVNSLSVRQKALSTSLSTW